MLARSTGTAKIALIVSSRLPAWLIDHKGMASPTYDFSPIGRVHSPLIQRSGAPRQPWEGAPEATLEIYPEWVEGLDGIQAGQAIWVLTWLHESRRSTLKVYPRGEPRLTGVFATRSPDRPNPIGLHRTRILGVERGQFIRVEGIEAIDGTPVIDIKPVLDGDTAPL
jgi:tRNA-Thr(GGU) m(6)t(6)A37 methyltransferase TsaA